MLSFQIFGVSRIIGFSRIRLNSYKKSISMLHNNVLGRSMNNNISRATEAKNSNECGQLYMLIAEIKQESKLCLEKEPRFVRKTFLDASLKNQHNLLYLAADRLLNLLDNTVFVEDIMDIYEIAPNHDFANVRANGFRTFLMNIRKILTHILPFLRKNRTTARSFFPKRSNLIEYVLCLEELALIINIMKQLPHFVAKKGNLFPLEYLDQLPKIGSCDPIDPTNLHEYKGEPLKCQPDQNDQLLKYRELVNRFDTVRQEYFYGRCLAYYYVEPARQLFDYLGSIMAGCADSFESNRGGLTGIFNTVFQSLLNHLAPEERGRIIARVTRNSNVKFAKTFWGLAEMKILTDLPNVLLPSLAICRSIILGPEPLEVILNKDNDFKKISIPPVKNSNGVEVSVTLRVLSKSFRKGQEYVTNHSSRSKISVTLAGTPSNVVKEPSPFLVMHIHGGGFVALSSEAHDVYLRPWADHLDCPVISVNYSLAPEAPYPQALDECFYAYCWAVQNRVNLGCTPDARIVICGDSAGGNLTMGTCLRAVHLQMESQPSGACMIYAPMMISCQPSPSRMLSISDPMLPMGILPRCLLAYSGIDEEQYLSNRKISLPASNSNQIYKPSYLKKHRSLSVPSLPSLIHNSNGYSSHQTPSTPQMRKQELTDPEKVQIEMAEEASLVQQLEGDYDPNLIYNRQNSEEMLQLIRECIIPQDAYKSPLLASDELLSKMPPLGIVCSSTDCFLDDGVEMAKRLNSLDRKVALYVLEDLPHAFLNFCFLGGKMQEATNLCRDIILDLLKDRLTQPELKSDVD